MTVELQAAGKRWTQTRGRHLFSVAPLHLLWKLQHRTLVRPLKSWKKRREDPWEGEWAAGREMGRARRLPTGRDRTQGDGMNGAGHFQKGAVMVAWESPNASAGRHFCAVSAAVLSCLWIKPKLEKANVLSRLRCFPGALPPSVPGCPCTRPPRICGSPVLVRLPVQAELHG